MLSPVDSQNGLVVGFDVLPSHSPRSKTPVKFACVVLHNGSVVREYPEVSRRDLLRTVREVMPRFLATDNIFEIVPDAKSLFSLVDRLPVETRLVQVTGIPPHQKSLRSLAQQYRVGVRGKPDPLQSARIAATLASMGVGYLVECFGEQTEVKVTRARKMGRGGQSVNRYRRKIHSEIQQVTRFIASQLKTAGIEFELDVRTSDFGYSSSRIVAYAPLPVIRGLVEEKHGGDYNVIVTPIKKRTEFLPLEPMTVTSETKAEYFILGLDPGTTAAICLIDFEGEIQLLESRKGLTRADIIRKVYERGIPVIIATDTLPVPHMIRKIAATLDTEIYTPGKPVPVSEKQETAREFSHKVRISNAHERDALAAAVYAYRSLLPKLEQVDHHVRSQGLNIDRRHLKALVARGVQMNEAIGTLMRHGTQTPEVSEEEPMPEHSEEVSVDLIRNRLEEALAQNRALLARLEDLQHTVDFLRFRESELERSLEIVNRENYWRVKRDREVVKKQSEIDALRQEVDRLRGDVGELHRRLELLRGVKRREIKGDMIAVKVVPQFSRESIEDYCKTVGLREKDIVLFEDASGGGVQTAGLLIEQGIRAVIVNTPLSHLAEEELVTAGIPVISADNVELRRVDEFAFISRKRFETTFQEFLKEVREKARQKGEEDLVELIERYRREGEH
ncbi:MAG: DUF460 domain-containing protein [Candidatus Thorarchaeota archaeon]|nr:DUF460 domain-containing protein [Candidatus Thorarchaeota archaeon]